MFISNKTTLFHMWEKENLVKNLKVPKYYEIDFPEKLLPLFMTLLAAPTFRNINIYLFEKTAENKLESLLIPTFCPH